MNNLISIVMSLILYNPLEAMILLLASWFFKPKEIIRNKFNLTEFIVKSYILGFFNYIIQIPEVYFQSSLLYGIFILINYFILMPIVLKIFGYKNSFLNIIIIFLIFHISIDIAIYACQLANSIVFVRNNFLYELTANLLIKIWQALILLIFLGGKFMLKKILMLGAKKNLGKMVASTVKGFGETKLSKKLAKEVKESK